MNDAELLRRYAEEGSQEAFAELVRLRVGLVYSAALRRCGGDAHRAQEVAQAVFTELARNAASLCRHSALIGWLYTSTRYTAAKIARSELRRRAREQEAYTMQDDPASLVPEIPEERLRPLLDDAMDGLSEIDRRTLLLRFFDGYSMDELGRCLGFTEPTAQKRVERALDKLRERLARRGITSTAAALTASLIAQANMAAPIGLAARVARAAIAPPGPVTGLAALKLMSTTKTTLGIAALVGILAVASALRETAILHQTAASLATADQENKNLESRARQLSQSIQALEDSFLAVRPRASNAPSGPEGTTGESSRAAGGASASTAFANDYLNHRMHDTVGKLVAWNNANYFGPLLQSAGLSDAQVARAEYLLGQSESFVGLDSKPLLFKTDPRSAAEINAELVQVIGEAGAASLSTYQIVRFVTDGLAGNLYGSEEPLTTQQASQLTQIMVSANQGTASPGGWLNPQSTDWPAAIVQAQGVLSPSQLAVLKNMAISNFGADMK